MSNTNTTRLGNPDIVNIAKQRFEKRQQSKLPSIIVNLPSGGVIYPKSHPLSSGQVEMRYMTAYDEDILTNITYIREGVVFEKLLESLVLTDVVISDIAELDRDGLIINARIVSYGSDYPVLVTDSKTGKQYERKVDLKKIQPKSFDLVADDNGEFEYKTAAGDIIKFSYNLTTNDLLITNPICSSTKTYRNKNKFIIDLFSKYTDNVKFFDWIINYELSKFGPIKYMDTVSAIYRFHGNGFASSMTNEETLLEINKIKLILLEDFNRFQNEKNRFKSFRQLKFGAKIFWPFLAFLGPVLLFWGISDNFRRITNRL